MITQRNLTILLILCTSLVLRGDGCNVLEQKDVEQVAGIPVPVEWISEGYTEATGSASETLKLAEDIREHMPTDPAEAAKILSLGVAGVQYKVLESTGHDARREGDIVLDTGGTEPLSLLTYDIPNNQTGSSGGAGDPGSGLTLHIAGTSFITGRLNTWLNQYKADPFGIADDSLLDFKFDLTWTSSPPPTAQNPDNFRWTTDLVVQVVQIITINGD